MIINEIIPKEVAVKCVKDLQLFVVITLVILPSRKWYPKKLLEGSQPWFEKYIKYKIKGTYLTTKFYQFQYQRHLVDQIIESLKREVPDEKDEEDDVGEGGGEVDHLAAGLDSLSG